MLLIGSELLLRIAVRALLVALVATPLGKKGVVVLEGYRYYSSKWEGKQQAGAGEGEMLKKNN